MSGNIPIRIQQCYDAIREYVHSLPVGAVIGQAELNVMLGRKGLSASGATLSKCLHIHEGEGLLRQDTRQSFIRITPPAKPATPAPIEARAVKPEQEDHHTFTQRIARIERMLERFCKALDIPTD